MKLTQDSEGNTSSKRVGAFGALIVAAGISIYGVIQDPSTAPQMVWAWLISGAALLGVTVLEKRK